MKYKQSENLTTQSVDDEILILDLGKDKIHQLNVTANFIWSKCNGNYTQSELAAFLSDEYEINIDVAEKDVATVIEQLMELELIEAVE